MTQSPALLLTLITALIVPSAGFAQAGGGGGLNGGGSYGAAGATTPVNPATGLPMAPMIDPTTGLPVTPPEKPWKDPDWKDPDKVLPDVTYDGLPLGEVARNLREQFNNAFDIIIPREWQDPNNPHATTFEPGSLAVKMQLKNVTASEVFNAMNLLFEGENTPCRWELRMNGSRPTAILRVLPRLLPPPERTPPPPKTERVVYFVGDLVGDKAGGMSIEQLAKTVSEVYHMTGEGDAVIKFHRAAQLLIVSGSPDDINVIQQTLNAMRDKARMDRRAKPVDSSSTAEPVKPR